MVIPGGQPPQYRNQLEKQQERYQQVVHAVLFQIGHYSTCICKCFHTTEKIPITIYCDIVQNFMFFRPGCMGGDNIYVNTMLLQIFTQIKYEGWLCITCPARESRRHYQNA